MARDVVGEEKYLERGTKKKDRNRGLIIGCSLSGQIVLLRFIFKGYIRIYNSEKIIW